MAKNRTTLSVYLVLLGRTAVDAGALLTGQVPEMRRLQRQQRSTLLVGFHIERRDGRVFVLFVAGEPE